MEDRSNRPKWLGLRTELRIIWDVLWGLHPEESKSVSDAERPELHLVDNDSPKPREVG